MNPAGIEKTLTSRHNPTVVGIINDDRVLIEPILFQGRDALSNVAIHSLHRIGIFGVVFPNYWKIRMIRKEGHLLWVILQLIRSAVRLTLVTGGGIVDTEKRLPLFSGLPTISDALFPASLFPQVPSCIVIPAPNIVVGLPRI